MNILFCGSNAPQELDTQLHYLSAAANRYQYRFMQALAEQGNTVQVFSYIGFPLEEGGREAIQKGKTPFPVRYVFKQQNMLKTLKECRQALQEQLRDADLCIAYNSVYAWFVLPKLCKKGGKKSVLVLADYSGSESYHSLPRKIYAWLMLQNIRKYDVVVGLSEQTKRYLTKKQRFICSEGGIDREFYDYFGTLSEKQVSENNKIFMYAGVLEKVTGLDLMLEAFTQQADESSELWISGKGSLEQEVVAASEKDSRIKYLGFLEYAEYLKCLERADVLVNPRNMNMEENRNNFPSKIMEYLATGKEILSTRFVGWEKFKENVTFCGSTVTDMQDALTQCGINVEKNREVRYTQNREFALSYLWNEQIKRIIKFIGGNYV